MAEVVFDERRADAIDALEDALAKGFALDEKGRVNVDAVMPLMEAARAVLMVLRGAEPIMPKVRPA